MPDELDMLCCAFNRVCSECGLTGAQGRAFLARALMTRYCRGVTDEDDLVNIARKIVWRRRGLGGLRVVQPPGNAPVA
jgi:hypothetical protein